MSTRGTSHISGAQWPPSRGPVQADILSVSRDRLCSAYSSEN